MAQEGLDGRVAIKAGTITPADLQSSAGTPSSSTFYRGDGQWAAPPSGGGGGGGGGSALTQVSTLPVASSSNQGNQYLLLGSGTQPDTVWASIQVSATKYRMAKVGLTYSLLNKAALPGLAGSIVNNWLCNETSGLVLYDAAGHDNLAINTGYGGFGGAPPAVFGTDSQAAFWNPSASAYASSSGSALTGTGDFSGEVCTADPADSTTRYMYCAATTLSANEPLDILRLSSNALYSRMYTAAGSPTICQESSALPAGLSHVVVTYNATTGVRKLYHNGTLMDTQTYSGTRQSISAHGLGASWNGSSFSSSSGWNGGIYFARLYNADVSSSAAAMYANL